VNYKRVAEKDGKEVPWEPNRQGVEYEKGNTVVLKDEVLERVDLEATQTVDIQDSSIRKRSIRSFSIEPTIWNLKKVAISVRIMAMPQGQWQGGYC